MQNFLGNWKFLWELLSSNLQEILTSFMKVHHFKKHQTVSEIRKIDYLRNVELMQWVQSSICGEHQEYLRSTDIIFSGIPENIREFQPHVTPCTGNEGENSSQPNSKETLRWERTNKRFRKVSKKSPAALKIKHNVERKKLENGKTRKGTTVKRALQQSWGNRNEWSQKLSHHYGLKCSREYIRYH